MNPFTTLISTAIAPVTKLIDEIHTSDEEKLKIKATMLEMQAHLTIKSIEYETKLAEARSNIIVAEAKGQSALQRNWRPITMLTFLALIILDLFDILQFRLPPEAWILLQLGIGGYVVGRSAEKVVSALKK